MSVLISWGAIMKMKNVNNVLNENSLKRIIGGLGPVEYPPTQPPPTVAYSSGGD